MAASVAGQKKQKPRKSKAESSHELAQIIWTLAMDGDINETHKGGNASRTLNQRLRDRGVTVDPKNIYNRMYTLEKRQWIKRVIKDNRVFAIRLTVDPSEAGPNPFLKGGRASGKSAFGEMDLLALVNGAQNGNAKHDSELSVRQRLEKATELMTSAIDLLLSVRTDLDRLNI